MPSLVSVVITAFNRAEYLEQSVKSVLEQTYSTIECLIVDDGSTDNTSQVAAQLTQLDARVKYLPKENGGVSSARNFGIKHAKGDWLQFLDADDWIPEHKIEFQINYAQESGLSEGVIYSDYERVFVDRNGCITERRPCTIGALTPEQLMERLLICPDFLANSPFPLLQQAMLLKRSLLEQVAFDERLKACEDREFVLNLLTRNVPFLYAPTVGAYYRKHASNMTDNESLMRDSYVKYFGIVRDRYPQLIGLCQTSVKFLLEKTIEGKDTKNFRALAELVQFPLYFVGNKFRVDNVFLLKLLYSIRLAIPSFLLYSKYRGPRSKKVLSVLSRTFSFTQDLKA